MIKTLEKQKMDIIKEMADINVKISRGKAELQKIKDKELTQFKDEGQEAKKEINKLFDNSKRLLEETTNNFNKIHKFHIPTKVKVLEKQKMDIFNEMADMNVKISKGEAELKKIKDSKLDFFKKQELEVKKRIDELLVNSRELLEESRNNFRDIRKFHLTTKDFADFIHKTAESVEKDIETFSEDTKLWVDKVNKKTEEISAMTKQVKNDQKSIEKEKEFIKSQRNIIEREKTLIESRQAQIRSALLLLNKKQNDNDIKRQK